MHTRPTPIDITRTLSELGDNPTLNDQSRLVSCVCQYFDSIKNTNLTQADLKFLQYIARTSGIPQFYDMLSNYEKQIQIEEPDLSTISNEVYNEYLECFDGRKLHKYQKQIYDLFEKGKTNRYFLSASTSFGKTHLLFDIIQKMGYTNVVLIFPTIALLSENLERIYIDPALQNIKKEYSIHTLSDANDFGTKNLFIFTPERFLSYIENDMNYVKNFDFVFIDEIYKIDNDYEIDEVQKENERDIAYRLASFYALGPDVDILLAGPYVHVSNASTHSFNKFLQFNNITYLNYNPIEIVSKSPIAAYRKVNYSDEDIEINTNQSGKKSKFIDIIQDILHAGENTLVYCYSRSKTEEYAKIILNQEITQIPNSPDLDIFLSHIANLYGTDWIVYQCLQQGIGIHHGMLPKYIQKETINLFNAGVLKILLCTTTITEGVNTTAKNLIVLNSKKGEKPLKPFDAKNIAGRAGRFMAHYSGRVIVLDPEFDDVIKEDGQPIEHKNYDKERDKTKIELNIIDDNFLNNSDKQRKENIKTAMYESNISPEIFEKYRMIGALDKITLYNNIVTLCSDSENLRKLQNCILQSLFNKLDKDGFELVIKCIKPIINNQQLASLANFYGPEQEWSHSLLTIYLDHYLTEGFLGLFKYKKIQKKKGPDKAMRETADFVYNTLKYQLVKYLGAFNLLYKYIISVQTEVDMEDVLGFDRLLSKLEYNAISVRAKKVSDYGTPNKIVTYFEEETSDEKKNNLKNTFDPYEQKLFKKLLTWINE